MAAIAASTERLELATGVTCPSIRYHPAIVAQAAATTALLSDGRFTLGVGSGEQLNEHVVGRGWPSVTERHEIFREALEIIRLLWSGGYQSYEGKHLRLEDARVFDLPETPPPIVVAIGGPRAAAIAAEHGDGIFATDPEPKLVEAYEAAGGSGAKYTEVPLAWAPDEDAAARSAHSMFRFGLLELEGARRAPEPGQLRGRDASSSRSTPCARSSPAAPTPTATSRSRGSSPAPASTTWRWSTPAPTRTDSSTSLPPSWRRRCASFSFRPLAGDDQMSRPLIDRPVQRPAHRRRLGRRRCVGATARRGRPGRWLGAPARRR